MAQKIVSFEVAKALKEAGYPQGKENTAYYNELGMLVKPNIYCGGKEIADAPTYIEVWLWLWREKKEYLNILPCCETQASVINHEHIFKGLDPEKAIAKAIDYLVENNLIK